MLMMTFRLSYSVLAVNTPKPYLSVSRKLGNILADGGHMTVNGAGKVCVPVVASSFGPSVPRALLDTPLVYRERKLFLFMA